MGEGHREPALLVEEPDPCWAPRDVREAQKSRPSARRNREGGGPIHPPHPTPPHFTFSGLVNARVSLAAL